MKSFLLILLFAVHVAAHNAAAQASDIKWAPVADEATLSASMPDLAKRVMVEFQEPDRDKHLNTFFRLQMVAGEWDNAIDSIRALRDLRRPSDATVDTLFVQYEVLLIARRNHARPGQTLDESLKNASAGVLGKLDNKVAYRALTAFQHNLSVSRAALQQALAALDQKTVVTTVEALDLVRKFHVVDAYRDLLPRSDALIAEDDARRYFIDENVLIKTPSGATLSAVMMRPRIGDMPQATALYFNIYANPVWNRNLAQLAAANGYASVVADARGKRLSPDEIRPYETETQDVNAVIDWISKQAWSNGKVGMYGGSYSGFAQWAALKHPHPALKTIVPYVAVIPGFGLPMENNVFLNSNYGWPFYVTNNKLLDDKTYSDRARWNGLQEKWYASGRRYREIDAVDGAPNAWLQRWLQHPAYDAYWQAMVPYGKEFAKIDIPILSITGYFDDAQISALQYVREHYRHNPQANHYLLIGPSDHVGAQNRPEPVFRGYAIDPVANISTSEITFQWLDHVLKGGPKPALLKDKINHQVMGANEWRHAPTLERASNQSLTLYLSNVRSGGEYRLLAKKPVKPGHITQVVDFADRGTENNDYYPDSLIRKSLEEKSGLVFISEPFDIPVAMTGPFGGKLKVTINKKDMDVGVVLYELTPAGEYFHLSYFLGRASYAKDMTRRNLLRPGRVEAISFDRTRMTSRQMSKGSRLVAVLNVNKNSGAQINYGTGKDVSDETIVDAKVPLRVQWHNDSYLTIPVCK